MSRTCPHCNYVAFPKNGKFYNMLLAFPSIGSKCCKCKKPIMCGFKGEDRDNITDDDFVVITESEYQKIQNGLDKEKPKVRKPMHPGRHLKEAYMDAYELTPEMLANHLGIRSYEIYGLIKEELSMTVNLAIRLSKAFNTTIAFWMNLQQNHDVVAIISMDDRINEITKIAEKYVIKNDPVNARIQHLEHGLNGIKNLLEAQRDVKLNVQKLGEAVYLMVEKTLEE